MGSPRSRVVLAAFYGHTAQRRGSVRRAHHIVEGTVAQKQVPKDHQGDSAGGLGLLAQQTRLQREDVVEDAVDPPSFQAVVGDQAGRAQEVAQPVRQRSVHPHLAFGQSGLQQLQAAVQRSEASAVLLPHAVPSTSTTPSVTRTLTAGRVGHL